MKNAIRNPVQTCRPLRWHIVVGHIGALTFAISVNGGDWPQASGPHGNFTVGLNEAGPTSFSRTHGENIQWATPLPSTGQGTPIISNGKVFVTSHKSQGADAEYGRDIVCLCLDQSSGREVWRTLVPGIRNTDLSSLFSDNTAASPVATDDRVVFVNVGGAIRCLDHSGRTRWSYDWTPFGRHHARLHEPMLHDGNLINVQYRYRDLLPEHTTKPGAKKLGRDRKYWTHLHAFDLDSGELQWVAKEGSSIHQTSILLKRSDGVDGILTGRGGGHQPPEEPYGLSMVNAQNGETLWNLPIPNYPSAQNACWKDGVACAFVGNEHWTIDAVRGRVLHKTSLIEDVAITAHDPQRGGYVTQRGARLAGGKRLLTKNSNILVGDWHYFRTGMGYYIGRIHLSTQSVEYLQVPVQVERRAGKPDRIRWFDALPNDMKTSEGFVASQDRRNAGNGWGHVSAASPIVVGDALYMPTMIGMVYVVQWQTPKLDADALLSISDLGPSQETWSLSSLAYSDGLLYARTLKELLCIGRPKE